MNDDSRLDCSDIPRSCCGQTEEYCTCTPENVESQTTDTQQLKAEIAALAERIESSAMVGDVMQPLEIFRELRQLSAV